MGQTDCSTQLPQCKVGMQIAECFTKRRLASLCSKTYEKKYDIHWSNAIIQDYVLKNTALQFENKIKCHFLIISRTISVFRFTKEGSG